MGILKYRIYTNKLLQKLNKNRNVQQHINYDESYIEEINEDNVNCVVNTIFKYIKTTDSEFIGIDALHVYYEAIFAVNQDTEEDSTTLNTYVDFVNNKYVLMDIDGTIIGDIEKIELSDKDKKLVSEYVDYIEKYSSIAHDNMKLLYVWDDKVLIKTNRNKINRTKTPISGLVLYTVFVNLLFKSKYLHIIAPGESESYIAYLNYLKIIKYADCNDTDIHSLCVPRIFAKNNDKYNLIEYPFEAYKRICGTKKAFILNSIIIPYIAGYDYGESILNNLEYNLIDNYLYNVSLMKLKNNNFKFNKEDFIVITNMLSTMYFKNVFKKFDNLTNTLLINEKHKILTNNASISKTRYTISDVNPINLDNNNDSYLHPTCNINNIIMGTYLNNKLYYDKEYNTHVYYNICRVFDFYTFKNCMNLFNDKLYDYTVLIKYINKDSYLEYLIDGCIDAKYEPTTSFLNLQFNKIYMKNNIYKSISTYIIEN